jgi:hypothetical protein
VGIGLTRICVKDGRFATEWTVVLLVVLHDDQAPDAENVVASKLDRTPFDLHAHGTRVIVDLGDVAKDMGVDFCADGFGEMFRELWVLDLTREGLLDTQSCSLIEFCHAVSIWMNAEESVETCSSRSSPWRCG